MGMLDQITAQSESGGRDFDRYGRPVRSRKGALFSMQVMPETARAPGFGLKPANPADPADMNRLGREYLGAMQTRYGGDPAKMWAAYNAGPGRVDKALSAGGDWLSHLPSETQSYVRNNTAMLQPRKGPNFAAMSQVAGGFDPLAPMSEQMPPQMPQQPMAPQMAQPAPQQQAPLLQPHKKGHGTLGAILGILGDSLAAYGGQRGVYAPFMAQQLDNEAQDNRFQQHLAAQQNMAIEKAKLAAMTPPKPTQTDRYVAEVLDPNTPAPRRQLLMQVLTHPLVTTGADGSQSAQYGAMSDQGGEDDWEYNN